MVDSWRASLALFLWIPITLHVFRRHPRARAALICFLGAAMFLPEIVTFKLPLFPEINKTRMALLAIGGALLLAPGRGKRAHVEPWWYLLVALDFIGSVGTWLTNTDPMYWGPTVLLGHNFKDGMYLFLSSFTTAGLASYLGMICFRTERDLDDCVVLLAAAGLIYTIPILIEARLSPQLHNWVYGYAPFEDFLQSIRYGGYRPQVFMTHGLMTSLFMLGPATAAVTASRLGMRVYRLSGRVSAWIVTAAVIICKSTGVWFYALVSLPIARWASPKFMARFAAVVILITLVYPWLRINEKVPIDGILEYAAKVSEDRKESLKFRFDNEEMLLEHALERPWFGWGSFGRNRVYDDSGRDISTTDGGWILALGSGGIIGYLAYFGIPVLSVLTVVRRLGRIRDKRHAVKIATLNMYLAVYWLDMLPNAPYLLMAHFFGGALCSITHHMLAEQRAPSRASQRARPVVARESTTTMPVPATRPGSSGLGS